MIIEIHGTSVFNKGAELMLVETIRRLGSFPGLRFAVAPTFGPFEQRARYGLRTKVRIEKAGRSKIGLALLPGAFLDGLGLVREDEIDAVVDASGFAFGDHLPQATGMRMAKDCQRWMSLGKPVILLPQALGPFETEIARSSFMQILRNVNVVYARDSDSFGYATDVAGDMARKVRLAPDITISALGDINVETHVDERTGIVVPNTRMLDRTGSETAGKYVPFLVRMVVAMRENGLRPALLIHDKGEDERFIDPVRQAVGRLDVLFESCPLKLKGILGKAGVVVASRFHALVGALSSGVPSIAVGWSHKYARLFEDFGCPEMVCEVGAHERAAPERLGWLLRNRESRARSLRLKTKELGEEVESVWEMVYRTLGVR